MVSASQPIRLQNSLNSILISPSDNFLMISLWEGEHALISQGVSWYGPPTYQRSTHNFLKLQWFFLQSWEMERKIPQFSTFCIREQCESKSCHEHPSQVSVWDRTASCIFQDQIPDLNQRTLHSWVNVTLLIRFMGWRSQQKESIFRSIVWVTPVSKVNATVLCFPGSLGVIFLLRPANTTAWARAHRFLVPHAPKVYQPALTGAEHAPPWTSPRSVCARSHCQWKDLCYRSRMGGLCMLRLCPSPPSSPHLGMQQLTFILTSQD